MRPTPEGVGNDGFAVWGKEADDVASMRPTPEGVGNSEDLHEVRIPVLASMRPTPEGVGNRIRLPVSQHRRLRFNEAHARRRGKSRDMPVANPVPHASMRPTPEGVGNVEGFAARLHAGCASMRPTPEGVGNPHGHGQRVANLRLLQ